MMHKNYLYGLICVKMCPFFVANWVKLTKRGENDVF
jgi:hypothetical protein